jgi:hypothetical protein
MKNGVFWVVTPCGEVFKAMTEKKAAFRDVTPRGPCKTRRLEETFFKN